MAMFETVVKIELSSPLLSPKIVEKLNAEQLLEEILLSNVLNYDQRDDHVSDKDIYIVHI